jgi:hypothetical protein
MPVGKSKCQLKITHPWFNLMAHPAIFWGGFLGITGNGKKFNSEFVK